MAAPSHFTEQQKALPDTSATQTFTDPLAFGFVRIFV